MLKELMVLQPWKHRKGTSERGEDWQNLAVSLNAISHESTIPYYSAVCSLSLFCNGKEKKGKVREEEREPQVLPLRRKQSYNSFLTNSWNFSKKATKTWKKQNGIRKKRQRKQRKCKRNANEQQGGKQKKKQSQWSKHYGLPERTGRDGSNLEEWGIGAKEGRVGTASKGAGGKTTAFWCDE